MPSIASITFAFTRPPFTREYNHDCPIYRGQLLHSMTSPRLLYLWPRPALGGLLDPRRLLRLDCLVYELQRVLEGRCTTRVELHSSLVNRLLSGLGELQPFGELLAHLIEINCARPQ